VVAVCTGSKTAATAASAAIGQTYTRPTG
jgi:hypothetical protein